MGRGFVVLGAPSQLPTMEYNGREFVRDGYGYVTTRDVVVEKEELRVIACALTAAEAASAHRKAIRGHRDLLPRRPEEAGNV